MTGMPHLTRMQWDFKDRLSATSRQAVNANPPPDKAPETTFYVYDASGQRVRKVTERQNSRKAERIYLGGFEIYREFDGNGNDIALERETLHIMDDKQCIALVETRTQGDDGSPPQLIRYQFGNHLGSASLELNDLGNVISYEEYTPYGSTSYQVVDQNIKAAAKRYRYTGKERDEESGLYYHRARFFAPWVGRWTACDPIAPEGRLSVYAYAADNPIHFVDPDGKQAVYPDGYTGPPIPELDARIRAEHEAFLKEHPEARFAEEHPIATEIIEGIQAVGAIIFLVQDVRSLTSGIRLPNRQQLRVFHADESGAMKIPGTGTKAGPSTPPSTPTKTPNMPTDTGPTIATAPANPAAAPKTTLVPEPSTPVSAQPIVPTPVAPPPTPAASPPPFVGKSESQMRRTGAKLLRQSTDPALATLKEKLLDDSGKFKGTRGKSHDVLADSPDLLEMGHVGSAKAGGKRVVLQSAWINQFDRVTVETFRGRHVENEAVGIGPFGIEKRTAQMFEDLGWIPKGTVSSAQRVQ
jgi:RHS repeat-associated protein